MACIDVVLGCLLFGLFSGALVFCIHTCSHELEVSVANLLSGCFMYSSFWGQAKKVSILRKRPDLMTIKSQDLQGVVHDLDA